MLELGDVTSKKARPSLSHPNRERCAAMWKKGSLIKKEKRNRFPFKQ